MVSRSLMSFILFQVKLSLVLHRNVAFCVVSLFRVSVYPQPPPPNRRLCHPTAGTTEDLVDSWVFSGFLFVYFCFFINTTTEGWARKGNSVIFYCS